MEKPEFIVVGWLTYVLSEFSFQRFSVNLHFRDEPMQQRRQRTRGHCSHAAPTPNVEASKGTERECEDSRQADYHPESGPWSDTLKNNTMNVPPDGVEIYSFGLKRDPKLLAFKFTANLFHQLGQNAGSHSCPRLFAILVFP